MRLALELLLVLPEQRRLALKLHLLLPQQQHGALEPGLLGPQRLGLGGHPLLVPADTRSLFVDLCGEALGLFRRLLRPGRALFQRLGLAAALGDLPLQLDRLDAVCRDVERLVAQRHRPAGRIEKRLALGRALGDLVGVVHRGLGLGVDHGSVARALHARGQLERLARLQQLEEDLRVPADVGNAVHAVVGRRGEVGELERRGRRTRVEHRRVAEDHELGGLADQVVGLGG